jgi:hypothetical protein
VVDGVGGEPGLVPVEEEVEETPYDAGHAKPVVVNEILIECPVVVEMVGDGFSTDIYGAIMDDLLGRVAGVIRDA